VEYLANDIQILEELGYQVRIADLVTTGIPLNCDIYFTWGFHRAIFPLLIANLCRKPHFVAGNVHMVGGAKGGPMLPSVNFSNRPLLEQWLTRFVVSRSQGVLATSLIEVESLSRLGAKNVHLVYHGIDTALYTHPVEPSQRKMQIMMVTHLKYSNIKRKLVREIIQCIPIVAAKYPNVQFVIVGGGRRQQSADYNELRNLSVAVGADKFLIWAGEVDRDAKIQLYQESSIYLQPSLFEGFGVAIAEAMACELPVVTSPVGAVPEVVGDCGLYCSTNTPEEIAEQICQLLADDNLRTELGRRARKRIVEHFSFAQRKKKLSAIIAK